MSKYSKEFISDISQFFNLGNDFLFVQKKMYEGTEFPLPHNIYAATDSENSMHGKVDEEALANLGTILLNDQLSANINAYHLTLPSVVEPGCNHALALMTDKNNKEIWFQDSHGTDMRKELHDFFKILLPGYKITCFNQIQQEARNDNSCFLLAEYNIIDMWHKKSGRPELAKEYDNHQARAAVWEIVKQIEPESETNRPKQAFSFGTKTAAANSKKYLIEQHRNTLRDFKYSILKQKNYKQLLQEAAAKAQIKHETYKQRLLMQNQLQI